MGSKLKPMKRYETNVKICKMLQLLLLLVLSIYELIHFIINPAIQHAIQLFEKIQTMQDLMNTLKCIHSLPSFFHCLLV